MAPTAVETGRSSRQATRRPSIPHTIALCNHAEHSSSSLQSFYERSINVLTSTTRNRNSGARSPSQDHCPSILSKTAIQYFLQSDLGANWHVVISIASPSRRLTRVREARLRRACRRSALDTIGAQTISMVPCEPDIDWSKRETFMNEASHATSRFPIPRWTLCLRH